MSIDPSKQRAIQMQDQVWSGIGPHLPAIQLMAAGQMPPESESKDKLVQLLACIVMGTYYMRSAEMDPKNEEDESV